MMPYKVEVLGFDTETHSNKDDVIVALIEYLLGHGVSVTVTWPDGFTSGIQAADLVKE